MTKTRQQIIQDVEAFCQAKGVAPERLCRAAAGDSRILERLKAGGDVTTAKMDDLYAWMAEYQPKPKKDKPHEA